MKRADSQTLSKIESLLQQILHLADLTEIKPGIFYRKRVAFVHFHDDAAGVFGDLKLGAKYVRLRVSDEPEQVAFMAALYKALVS